MEKLIFAMNNLASHNQNHPIQARRLVLIAISLFSLLVLILTSSRPIPVLGSTDAHFSNNLYLPLVGKNSYIIQSNEADWLKHLNLYRSMANLPPVNENSDWSKGDRLHARYMVKNNVVVHDEVVGNPWYTPEGKLAAQSANLVGSGNQNNNDLYAVNAWIQAPFHAVGLLDPELSQIGFGSYRESDGVVQMAAAMDILRGLEPIPSSVSFPVMWPANGTRVPLTSYSKETPNPLTACPGYVAPSGLPIILQVGPGTLRPIVSGSVFKTGNTELPHCVFNETTYTNPDGNAQVLARTILGERDAIVLIPRDPLVSGNHYTVSITADSQTYTWTFAVDQNARALAEENP